MHFIIEAKLLVISCELVNTFLGFSKIGNPVKIEFGGPCLAGQWTFVWFVTGESVSQENYPTLCGRAWNNMRANF